MITSMQLAYYGPNGERVMDFMRQPTTEDIRNCMLVSDQFVVQLIGELFTVYATATLQRQKHIRTITIGLPVAEHYDYDTAVMTALLSQ